MKGADLERGGGTELSPGAIRLSANLSISTQLIISSSRPIGTDTVMVA